jgi:hypothetical protein
LGPCTCGLADRKKKGGGEIALSFASPEKEKYFLFIYEVITWEFFYKRSTNHYYRFLVKILSLYLLPDAHSSSLRRTGTPSSQRELIEIAS